MVALAWVALILFILLALTGWRMGRALALGFGILAALIVVGLGFWAWSAHDEKVKADKEAAWVAVNCPLKPGAGLTDDQLFRCHQTSEAIADITSNATAAADNAASAAESAVTTAQPSQTDAEVQAPDHTLVSLAEAEAAEATAPTDAAKQAFARVVSDDQESFISTHGRLPTDVEVIAAHKFAQEKRAAISRQETKLSAVDSEGDSPMNQTR